MSDLSVLIPARNEMWLKNTVDDVLKNIRGNTDIIVVADGAWPLEPLTQDPRVNIIHYPVAIGQRAATNQAAKASNSKFIMKLDAHCAVAEGFDVKLMADCEPNWTVIPRMYNLHVFDWVCQGCGSRGYQGPTPATHTCGSEFKRELIWKPRLNRQTDFARFDHELHFQYWGEYKNRFEAQGDIADVMSSVGACWFMHRDRFWELGGLDEAHGSWGQMGVEIACKSWLSGGRQVVNKKTWFSHLFRTQGGDFSFPYPMSGAAQEAARAYSKDLWRNNKWSGQVRPFEWIIKKFSPVPDWPEHTTKKACVYYTDSKDLGQVVAAARRSIERSGLPIYSVSLKPLEWGQNIVIDAERGYLTMFKQILAGLEASTADVVFLTEHDVLYHSSHFDFTPPRDDTFYYNDNVWKVDATTGRALHYDCNQTSGLCAYRALLIAHYTERILRVEKEGFNRKMGFEPGTRSTRIGGIDDRPYVVWQSAFPNIDIRHSTNLTPSRWSKDEFRNQRYTKGWVESDSVPGWGLTLGNMEVILKT